MTRAPSALASWMAVVPMPEEPPCTSRVSPAFEPAALEHVVPDREECFRERRPPSTMKGRPGRQRVTFVSEAIFGVAAADHQRHDRVAQLPAARLPAPQRYDLAGNLQPRNVGGARRRRVETFALHDIGPVDARGRDLNQDLAFAGHGQRTGFGDLTLPARPGCRDRNGGHRSGEAGHGRILVGSWI